MIEEFDHNDCLIFWWFIGNTLKDEIFLQLIFNSLLIKCMLLFKKKTEWFFMFLDRAK